MKDVISKEMKKRTEREKLRSIFNSMKQRCNNPNDPAFAYYGGRGINVCKKWLKFSNFLKDMYPSYKHGLWLDRKNNNKGYTKANCRWATPKNQCINRRNTRLFRLGKIRLTFTDWAIKLGIKRSTLAQRYYVYGWSIDRVLNYKLTK